MKTVVATYSEAVKRAKAMAKVELGRCRLYKTVEGTRYHSGRSDERLFFCNQHRIQIIEKYVEPEGYSLVYGPQFDKE